MTTEHKSINRAAPVLSYDVNTPSNALPRFAVAPMMDWTDRHCRYFHRQLTRHALLYTEMVVADALIHGDIERHLRFHADEHPLALQLGGSEPEKLIFAAKLAQDWGYDEVNLNVGCPSDRVQSGTFGACLMREPELVARCVEAMKSVVDSPVTVKCRIGVDDQEPRDALFKLAADVFAAGADGLWVHARKAWLKGLSPKENRDIPPLDYEIVRELKRSYSDRFIGLNGGLATLEQAQHEGQGLDGVMLGRAAYHDSDQLRAVDKLFYGDDADSIDDTALCEAMMEHAAAHIAAGGRLHHVTRHMLGLFSGRPGARRYRNVLSVGAVPRDAGPEVIADAFSVMRQQASAA
ncbi:tRNA dihydrouridine(20/20a) synthase DusA [Ahrensia sp. R2A130]|uniref:tRNA dihydrouridine(20/20a) synthase DusA n=1 Tax=Ahrensia sp. R2A130 TaxID=744979 RepID=UPI0001E0F83D|nr:tRNA dihydrouridine(20/20a) synthase DusA [Ahrensia sp. R2A130]EFL90485.1 tRNA-dihydrouridine synthase A [Ahrensia sp. R2A130]